MRGAHAGEALGLGFHHLAEGVAAVGALLLQVVKNRGQSRLFSLKKGVRDNFRENVPDPFSLQCAV